MNVELPGFAKLAKSVESYLIEAGTVYNLIEVDQEEAIYVFRFPMEMNEDRYRIIIECHEHEARVNSFIYWEFIIPEDRMSAIALCLNKVNAEVNYGRFACVDANNPKGGVLQWRSSFDMSGSRLSIEQIENLRGFGLAAFVHYEELFRDIVVENTQWQEAWDAQVEREQRAASLDGSGVPLAV